VSGAVVGSTATARHDIVAAEVGRIQFGQPDQLF
jgi:hypothetical protein